MITIFLVENEPWVFWTDIYGNIEGLGRNVGEWAWVGRYYK